MCVRGIVRPVFHAVGQSPRQPGPDNDDAKQHQQPFQAPTIHHRTHHQKGQEGHRSEIATHDHLGRLRQMPELVRTNGSDLLVRVIAHHPTHEDQFAGAWQRKGIRRLTHRLPHIRDADVLLVLTRGDNAPQSLPCRLDCTKKTQHAQHERAPEEEQNRDTHERAPRSSTEPVRHQDDDHDDHEHKAQPQSEAEQEFHEPCPKRALRKQLPRQEPRCEDSAKERRQPKRLHIETVTWLEP